MPPLIHDLAVILGVAGLIGLIFQRIRQPVVLGYILAGFIVGPYTPPFQLVTDIPSIRIWAELGVIFLMFSLGLEFSFRKLAAVGVSAGVTAGLEVLFFLPVGYGVGKMFGWPTMDCIFLGAMLSISSTTVIIKSLEELKLKTRRFAQLIFAVLVVEDLIAILLLVALSTLATNENFSALTLLTAAGKLFLVVGGWFVIGYFILPRFMKYVGKVSNNEILTILSLGLCLGLVVFANHFQYSTALGAFIMGSILAESTVLHRIEERMESLRDLFGAIFFVSIGMLIDPRQLWEHKVVIGILCVVAIVGKIVSSAFGALVSGQTFKNSVRVGFSLAQIGEFSFIIAGLGMTLKVTSDFLYPVAVAVSLVTTFTTPYLIGLSEPVANFLEKKLPPRLRALLNRYAVWTESKRTGPNLQRTLLMTVMRWLLNGLISVVIFTVGAEFLVPYLPAQGGLSLAQAALLSWALVMLISAPFIWGMFTAFEKIKTSTGPTFLFRVLTLILIGLLSAEFFPGKYVMMITTTAVLIFFGLFHRQLEVSYRWYEANFLSSFKKKPSSTDWLKNLTPWDPHLVKMEVHPNGPVVQKSLLDLELRTRYGINVVAIQRGLRKIVAPKPQEVILPGDTLIVLGTDEQVEILRESVAAPLDWEKDFPETSQYELRHLYLQNSNFLIGQSIRESGLRERFHTIVVGIERNGQRSMNPDSDLKLLAHDILWIVGEKKNLDDLMGQFPVA